MKTLRRLCAAIILTSALGLYAFADDRLTPQCGNPDPGQIDTPPCVIAQAPTLGEMNVPTVADRALTLTEIADNVLQSMWSLF